MSQQKKIYSNDVAKYVFANCMLQIKTRERGNLPAFLGVKTECLQRDKDRNYPYLIPVHYKDSIFHVRYQLVDIHGRLERLYFGKKLCDLIAEKYNWDKTNESFTPGRIDIVVNSQNELELQFFDEQGNNL